MCSSYKHASVQINSGGGLLVLYAENSSCSLILSNFLSCMFVSRPGSDASCKGIRFLTKNSVKLYGFNLEEMNMIECVDGCFSKMITSFFSH